MTSTYPPENVPKYLYMLTTDYNEVINRVKERKIISIMNFKLIRNIIKFNIHNLSSLVNM